MAIIDRVKYDGPPNVLVWRHPPDDLTWGTQVIVNQTQEVLFLKSGAIFDVLGPGTHTLKTANIPLLRGFIKVPFGGETPFAAEVYYVNKAVHMDVKWGTSSPIPIQDPKFNVILPVRAFGQFGVQVADARQLFVQLSATSNAFTVESLTELFRGVLMTRAKDYISELIVLQKTNIFEMGAKLEEMSSALQKKLEPDFGQYGVKLVNFFFSSLDVPENDETVQKVKKALADKAEMDILGDGYRVKRTLDALEKAASNEGGGAGAGAGLGMGLGAGMGLGNLFAQNLGQSMPGAAAPAAKAAALLCAACKAENAAGARFCSACGGKIAG